MPQTTAVLLSRQPLRPCAVTEWVRRSHAAVEWLKENNLTLCTSIGVQTWELLTALAAMHEIPAKLYVSESKSTTQDLCSQFALPPDTTEIIPLPHAMAAKEGALLMRDRAIIDAADILLPVSIRPSGHMATLLADAASHGKEINTSFQMPGVAKPEPLAYTLNESDLSEEIDSVADQYLVHWTRASNTAWPDERLIDYYRAVIASPAYPRAAFETLRHIVATKCLIATGRHMPGNLPCVSFTALSPREVVPLMRWRARYTQMSFEPYGIGIRKEESTRLGILPVRYADSASAIPGADNDRWLYQTIGSKTDWRQEREFRCRGDLDLSSLSPDSLVLFARTRVEAQALCRESGIRCLPMTKEKAGEV